jgi:hypothetical protein
MNDRGHWKLYDALGSKLNLDDRAEHRNVRQVILKVLLAVAGALPEPAHDALKVAGRFHDNNAAQNELTACRVAMWDLIKGKTYDLTDPFVASIRASIFALYPPNDENSPHDVLYYFLEFCDCAHFPSERICDAIRAVYADALAEQAHI